MITIERVSVGSGGIQASNGLSAVWWEAVSGDGQYATFTSSASDLTGDPTGNTYGVFVYDSLTNTTERIPGAGITSSISADGRYVAFSVLDNGIQDAAIYDRITQTTELISPHASAQEHSESLTISADGRYVLFESTVSSLTGDLSGYNDLLFVYDRVAHITTLVPGWTGAIPFISADGRYVGFGDQIYDRLTGTIEHVLVGTDGKATTDPTGDTFILGLSADDRYVVFQSGASNLVNNDTNGYTDIFVYDRVSHTTERVSVASDGTQANGPSTSAAMSADGRYVAFFSSASDLVPDDTNKVSDAFAYDRVTHTTQRISLSSSGTQADGPSSSFGTISISADGQHIVFRSDASNLVPNDTNGNSDIFLASLLINQPQNNLPAIDAAHSIVSDTINERPNVTGSLALDVANGALAFTDADLNDRPAASVTHQTVTWQDSQRHVFQPTNSQIAAFENALSIAPEAGNTNTGKFDWSFTAQDSTFDFVGVGESITVSKTIEIDDGHGGKLDQDVTVAINGSNDKPTAVPDFASVLQGGTLTMDAKHGVLANDADPDVHDILHVTQVNGSTLSVGHPAAGKYGTLALNADGSWTYVSNKAGPGGTDIFSYSIDDGHGGTASSSLSIFDQAAAQVQATNNSQIVTAAKALESLIGSDMFWVNLDSAKHLYDAITNVYKLIKDDSNFLQLADQMDALQAAGVDGDFIAAWRSLLADAEANVLTTDLRPVWKVILDKTVDIAIDYLVGHQLLSTADKSIAESIGKSVVNFVTADLKGELWDQSLLIAKEIAGLNADHNGLVNDEIRNGLIDIQYLQQPNVLANHKIQTSIDQEIALMARTGDDLVNTSINPIEIDAGYKVDLVSMILRGKTDQLRGNNSVALSDIAKAESYAVSLDEIYGLHNNPLAGPLNNHFESFATSVADTYHVAGWHI